MAARLIRAAVSFAIVLATYWVYALVAVPLIEPRAEARIEHTPPPKPLDPSGRYKELFAAYFPKGHWVYDRPKVLANDQTMLLIKDYTPLPGGRVELNPCLILFFPEPQAQNFKPQRQAVILDAPQGAVLQFEDGFNLSQAKIGRLIHGQLRGEISLRSDMKQPGPQDDLLVLTRDVQITESRIYTDHDVQFRVGANAGHGSELELRLLQSTKPGGPTGMNISGLQSLRLARNVKMNLVMHSAGLLPDEGGKPKPRVALPLPGSKQGPTPPVEITCRGPFLFDLVGYAASFEEQVDVLRLNPNGPSDQLTCEQLSVFFTPKTRGPEKAAAPARKAPGGLSALEPTRLEAIGEPVVVRSPSTSGQARCQKLKYDLLSRTVELESPDEVTLIHGTNEIHAPALHYQPSEQPGGLGAVWASGPGWVRAAAEKNPNQRFEARWSQELHLRRHEGTDVISLRGRPQLGVIGMGRITSDEFHMWLREAVPVTPSTSIAATEKENARKFEPDRLLATGDVIIESPQLNGGTERLEAWFAAAGAAPPAPKVRAQPASRSSSLIPADERQLADAPQLVLTAFRGPANPQAAAPRGGARSAAIDSTNDRYAQVAAPASSYTPPGGSAPPMNQAAGAAPQAPEAAAAATKSVYDLHGKLIRLQLSLVGGIL